MSNFREKLKGVKVTTSTHRVVDNQVQTSLGRGDLDVFRHKIKDGNNYFRLLPPHEESYENLPCATYEACSVCYIPAMVAERKDGEIVYKDGEISLVKGTKPVFNSNIHGKLDSSGQPLLQDLIEKFKDLAWSTSKTMTKTMADEFLKPIKGFYSKDSSKRLPGLSYQTTFECYAVDISTEGEFGTLGTLDLKTSVKKRLVSLASLESATDPMGVDPFYDIDEGVPIRIVYNSNATEPKDYYTTDIFTVYELIEVEGRGKVKVPKSLSIPDAILSEFEKLQPLAKKYRNVFKGRDLELQMKGLEMFCAQYSNEQFDYNELLEEDEFVEHFEKLKELYPPQAQETEQEEEDQDEDQDSEEEDDTEDMFSFFSYDELKDFALDNAVDIEGVKRADLKNHIRLAWAKINSPEPLTQVGELAKEEEEEETTDKKPSSLRDRMKKFK